MNNRLANYLIAGALACALAVASPTPAFRGGGGMGGSGGFGGGHALWEEASAAVAASVAGMQWQQASAAVVASAAPGSAARP
jgi:hypothetical protein